MALTQDMWLTLAILAIASDPLLGLEPFEFFDFTPVGLMLLISSIGFMVTLGRRILPDYGLRGDIEQAEDPEELIRVYSLAEKVSYVRVRGDSRLVDQSIASSQIRRNYGLTIVEILRYADARPMVRIGDQRLVLQSNITRTYLPDW